MARFFTVYKTLGNKETAVDEVIGSEEVMAIIGHILDSNRKRFNGSHDLPSRPTAVLCFFYIFIIATPSTQVPFRAGRPQYTKR